ncbi:hypothetical protein J2129_001898 [Methanofollis sp. W23]|nr:hypothetical protein [Methanofollis sp. W23]
MVSFIIPKAGLLSSSPSSARGTGGGHPEIPAWCPLLKEKHRPVHDPKTHNHFHRVCLSQGSCRILQIRFFQVPSSALWYMIGSSTQHPLHSQQICLPSLIFSPRGRHGDQRSSPYHNEKDQKRSFRVTMRCSSGMREACSRLISEPTDPIQQYSTSGPVETLTPPKGGRDWITFLHFHTDDSVPGTPEKDKSGMAGRT